MCFPGSMASSDGVVEMKSPESKEPQEKQATSPKDAGKLAQDEKSAADERVPPKPSEIPRLDTAELSVDEIPIGRGGYGYVYRATHEAFGTVAIKTMISDGILPMR